MNGKKRNLITDTEAVSGVIGAILLMAIAVTMFTMFQATVIPDLNRKVEWDHVAEVNDEMSYQKTNIRNAGGERTQHTSDIHLGVRYPNRVIFINPAVGVSGSITIDNTADIEVTFDSEPIPFPSSRIIYELHGSVNLPKIVYEHGSIIWDYENGNATQDVQSLVINDGLFYIPVVYTIIANGNTVSESGLSVLSKTIYPYENLPQYKDIDSEVSITLNTEYLDVWKNNLLSEDVIDKLGLSDTTITVDSENKQINIVTSSTHFIMGPNQIQTPPNTLYAGMITCSPTEIPEDEEGDRPYYGSGNETVGDGAVWKNVPSSYTITKMIVADITYDDENGLQLDEDIIKIFVSDYELDWWRAEIEFEWYHVTGDTYLPKIKGVTATAKGKASSSFKTSALPSTPFDSSTTIDLLDESNYETTASCYQNADIDTVNTLYTEIYDTANPAKDALAVKFFDLEIA